MMVGLKDGGPDHPLQLHGELLGVIQEEIGQN